MKALVIGRFQPVHLGHMEKLRQVDSEGLEKIIIAVGDAGKGRTERNPFTYYEVLQMLMPVTEQLATPVEIYRVPDINNKPKYARHVEKITGCKEDDTYIVSNNDYTLDCFTQFGKDYQPHDTGFFHQVDDALGNGYISATKVRRWIAEDGPWQEYVPESTKDIIETIDGVKIVKGLYRQQPEEILKQDAKKIA